MCLRIDTQEFVKEFIGEFIGEFVEEYEYGKEWSQFGQFYEERIDENY